MQLQGKLAVITGASKGIGRALSGALAQSGCDLFLTDIEEESLKSVAAGLKELFDVQIKFLSADLMLESDRQRLILELQGLNNPPDILINNAGIGYFERFAESSISNVLRVIQLNIVATVMLTREFISMVKNRSESKIVNISSSISRLPYSGMAVYGATKGFISSFSESLASELYGTNISVLCFHPGFTKTEFLSAANMDTHKTPQFLFRTPEFVVNKIITAIKKDKTWAYADIYGRLANQYLSCFQNRFKTKIFKNIFWELPE